ncbi:MAG: HupE/UreJ family protein [Chitinophagaceae bacterium]|nr:HupE/UreJ family protein [Chitinophagaceae bacterium]
MQDFYFYFGPGWKHIIGKDALDHQLFIAALAAIYLLKDWKQVLILVTAFTIGHSLTLALSVYDVIRFDSKWVEFLIPLTIVITALSNLFQKKFTPRSISINYFLALAFGLIHGMGFANYIRFAIAGSDQNIGWSLFGFNVGLEAGQIVVVAALLLLSHLIVTILKVNRRDWVIFLSAAVFGIALKMSLDRLPIKKKSHEETHVIELPATDQRQFIAGTKYSEQPQFKPCQ